MNLTGVLSEVKFAYDSDCQGGDGSGGTEMSAMIFSVRRGCYSPSASASASGLTYQEQVLGLLDEGSANFAPLYDASLPIRENISVIASRVYGAAGVDYTAKAERSIEYLQTIGLGGTPICMAKTQYSLSDDATRLGRPTGFRITVQEVYPCAGAGFVVAQCGDIMTMPGLPKEPAAERMAVKADGSIVGLF